MILIVWAVQIVISGQLGVECNWIGKYPGFSRQFFVQVMDYYY